MPSGMCSFAKALAERPSTEKDDRLLPSDAVNLLGSPGEEPVCSSLLKPEMISV